MLACLDGAIVPLEQACIPATDPGLLRGDGVFEVVRLYGGRPFALDEHLQRMRRSAENLRLPLDADAVAADARRLLDAAQPGDCVLRMLVTRGGHRVALIEELPEVAPALTLASVTYAPTRLLDAIKSLSYAANMLASRLARERGADEALLVTPEGRVLEAPTASFFWVDGEDRLCTPPLADHLLDSITRRTAIECCGGIEVAATLDDVRRAREAFIASTLREIVPVRRIDDVELPAGGPRTQAAARAVGEHIAERLA